MSLIERVQKLIGDKLDQTDLGWKNRPYNFYLIFGVDDESESPWIKSNWDLNFQPYIDLLIKQTEYFNETGLRVIKYQPEKRTTKKNNTEFIYHSEVKLGRLKWDTKSHEKWTIQNDADNHFSNFELWTPIWTVCEKRGSPPDIFITISNQRDFDGKLEIQFGYFIVVAVAKNLNIDSKPIIRQLSEKINAKATVLKTRRWGEAETVGNWTFINGIQDTYTSSIYKRQNIHSFNFGELDFESIWEIIYKRK